MLLECRFSRLVAVLNPLKLRSLVSFLQGVEMTYFLQFMVTPSLQ